jgi:hypothetical protein
MIAGSLEASRITQDHSRSFAIPHALCAAAGSAPAEGTGAGSVQKQYALLRNVGYESPRILAKVR